MNSILQSLAQSAMGFLSGSNPQQQQLVQSVLGMLGPNGANAASIVAKLQQSGLTEQVASWISTGPNQAVTGEQMTQALGADQVQQIADQAGVPAHQVGSQLAALLPQLIDTLSPNGTLEQGQIGNVLGSLLSKIKAA